MWLCEYPGLSFQRFSSTRLLACLIVAPQRGYDEPAILSYAISSFCPTAADGLHSLASIVPSLFGSAALNRFSTIARLIFVQGPVIVRIGRSEIAAIDPTTQCLLQGVAMDKD